MVEQDQELRAHAGDLAAQLGADRAAGAGHEDDLVLEVGADAVELHDHRLAAEHVLDPHLAELAGQLHAASQELEDGRQRSDRYVALAASRDDLGAKHARGRGDRDHHLVGSPAIQDLPDLVGGAEDLHARRRVMPRLRGSSSTKPIARAPRFGVQLQLADDHLAAGPRADD